jgi:hypothetical protein
MGIEHYMSRISRNQHLYVWLQGWLKLHTTRRFVEQGVGYDQDKKVSVYSDATLLPQDFEFVFASS